MSEIDWADKTVDRTCIACGRDLEDDDGAFVLADLRYSSQGFTEYTCPRCRTFLSIQEVREPVYIVRRLRIET